MSPRVPTMPRAARGFTLLELVVVLGLLTVVAALVAPQLRGFVAGRASEEECRRLLALTRHARDVAIGQGARVTVWMSDDGTEYGMRGEGGKVDAVTFTAATNTTVAALDEEGSTPEESTDLVVWPDGEIDIASPAAYEVRERGEAVWRLELNEAGTRYEVATP